MKIRGPFVTLAAVAALGVGILLVNMSKEESAPPANPYRQPTTTAVAAIPSAPTPPPAPPAAAFPAKADYVGKIPISSGTITLDIAIDGNKAVAYACDGKSIESWLRGSATNGALSLANKDKTSRLEGHLDGNAVVGTLWIGEKKWDFKADPAQPPAGLYVYDNAGVRNSWIIDGDGGVTGLQRRPDGSTAPAPGLSIDRTAVIDGQTIVATRVEGASDV
ncbi:MAG: hypothetical protein QOF67_1573 [Mycobacterium sp.]|jgi:hypothetical protein|nr:hypothetical protein [Mycobacterium sp.]